jgi:mRNA-degrading endonuclease toxin of MazEF toxin-antitoxin module
MRVNRGDVVLVDYPFAKGGAKVRPALVVQNDRDNARMTNTIVAQISGNAARAKEATQHLIELTAEPGCGLARDSALIATKLVAQRAISVYVVRSDPAEATIVSIVG